MDMQRKNRVVCEKKEIKCSDIIKRYKKWLSLMLQSKTSTNIAKVSSNL